MEVLMPGIEAEDPDASRAAEPDAEFIIPGSGNAQRHLSSAFVCIRTLSTPSAGPRSVGIASGNGHRLEIPNGKQAIIAHIDAFEEAERRIVKPILDYLSRYMFFCIATMGGVPGPIL